MRRLFMRRVKDWWHGCSSSVLKKGVTLLTQIAGTTRLLLEDGRIAGVEVREGDRAATD